MSGKPEKAGDIIQNLAALLFAIAAQLIGRTVQCYARLVCTARGWSPRSDGIYRRIEIEGIVLQEKVAQVDGHAHLVTEAGNPDAAADKTVVLMGGIPTDSSETFHWLVAQLCLLDSLLRCVIVHLPFTEGGTAIAVTSVLSRHDAKALPYNTVIDCSGEYVDTRYDHKNQAVAAKAILSAMNIEKAHFVGHDRGAVVFDYLIADHPDAALSYSRGAQLWDFYDEQWSDMAPELIVGPPHRLMAVPWQCRILFFAVVALGKPVNLLSPGFREAVKTARRGTPDYERKTHLLYAMLCVPDAVLQKVHQGFMQTDSTEEVRSRDALKATTVPIMQFQGEDEFKLDSRGTLVSDQPYFGQYNLFRNEVEDLYPQAYGQDSKLMRSELLTHCDSYKLLALKEEARMTRFALIPHSAHFNVVENPAGCAAAIHDFILSQV